MPGRASSPRSGSGGQLSFTPTTLLSQQVFGGWGGQLSFAPTTLPSQQVFGGWGGSGLVLPAHPPQQASTPASSTASGIADRLGKPSSGFDMDDSLTRTIQESWGSAGKQ